MEDVRREAQRPGTKVHFTRMAELIKEKNAGLPKGHPDRTIKGRCVLLGNMVKGENFESAVYAEVASAPAAIEAARTLDAYSCIGSNVASQSDATPAHT